MANESIETEIDITKPVPVDTERSPPRVQVRQPVQDDSPHDGIENDLDLEIVDDTPEVDRNRPKPPPKSAVPTDEEIGRYSENVQKRIKQMKLEYHEERRQKEAAFREHSAAIEMAKRIRAENEQLRKLVEQSHATMLGSNKSASENEIASLRESLRAAHEAGDSVKIAELQEKMSKAAARLVSIEQTQPLKFEEPPQQQQQPVQQPRVQLSGAMQGWMQDNPWFNGQGDAERRMTSYAFGVHDSLIRQGVVPESPAYFKAINDEMRSRFPEYYGEQETDTGTRRSPPSQRRTVGSASRLAGGGPVENRSRTRVTLTQSELAVAKRVGVSPQQYAREKLKAMEQNDG